MIKLSQLRNIGIMAHIDAGKTTATERMLYHAGKIYKIGEVHEGQAQMDWMAQEQERGITITSAATAISWKNFAINIIDTPGHVDFTVEVERSLRILDGAIAVLDAQTGVEPQTETVWRQATKYNVPRIVFANKMDKIGANFIHSVKSIHTRLGGKAFAIQLPIGAENDFKGIIDIVAMKAYYYDGHIEEKFECKPIPEEYKKEVEIFRTKLIDTVADYDEKFLEKYLDTGVVDNNELKIIIRKATLTGTFFPVLCGSAFKNKGIKLLLDAVLDYLPSPLETKPIIAHLENKDQIVLKNDIEIPFAALVFKIMTDPYVGRLTYFRIYTGTLKSGTFVYNLRKNKRERIGRLLKMHANKREEITEAFAGDIVAAVGLKNASTGDTICDEKRILSLESMQFPEPVISQALEPKTKSDQDKLAIGLQKLSEEDPTFRRYINHETNQTIIAGMGELHLDIIVDRLKREFKVVTNVGKPEVSYRETITTTGECEGKYIKQSGGRGQYGHVWIKFEPNKNKGFEFVNKITSGRVPREYINPVKNGIEDSLKGGLIANYPLIDIKATLYDGSYHDVDSSEMAFKIAASLALKEATKKCQPILLEPIMKVEVTVPDNYYGEVLGDISSRRGKIDETIKNDNSTIIQALIPLNEMFGYATDLRSFTQGRGIYTMKFNHYQQAPKKTVDELIIKK